MGRRHCLPAAIALLLSVPALALDLDLRLKWFATAAYLPAHDLQRQ